MIGKAALIDITNTGVDDVAYLVTASAVVSNAAAAPLQARCDLVQGVDAPFVIASRPVTVPAAGSGSSSAHVSLLQWVVAPAGGVTTVSVACVNGGVPQFTAIVTAVRVGMLTIQ
jgi:hypothetical protein